MTEQTERDRGALSPSLQAKLQQFADGLAPGEAAQLRSIQTGDVAGYLMPSLREKVQRTAAALTAEEAAELHALLQDADVRGYMVNLWDDSDPANQGRPRPLAGSSGGGGSWNLGALTHPTMVLASVSLLNALTAHPTLPP